MADPADRNSDMARARSRLRGLGLHFVGYTVAMIILVAVNVALEPENRWFVWPLVGWGGLLAIHTAWAMGLFDILTNGSQRHPGTDR